MFRVRLDRTMKTTRRALFYFLFLLAAIFLVLHLRNHYLIVDLYYGWINPDFSVENWKLKTSYCQNNMVVYGDQFAVLRSASVYPGKNPNFCLPCQNAIPAIRFFERKEKNHLNDWLTSTCIQNDQDNRNKVNNNFTVAVRRYEYANMYRTMNDWYNIYVQARIVGQSPENISILLTGTHPTGPLDDVWTTLYKNVKRLDQISKPVVYSQLMWSMTAYNSPMLYHYVQNPIPFIEDFQTFFINRHGIKKAKELDCEHIKIVFLWRRNYVSHVGNKAGLIKRKVRNEDELIAAVEKSMPGHEVEGVQLDQMSMTDQLKIITNTDIFISMHGAGMTHVIFLPSHAGVLELLPNNWIMPYPPFKSLARWRGLHYDKWRNPDPKLEYSDFSTYVSPTVITERISLLYNKMCMLTKSSL